MKAADWGHALPPYLVVLNTVCTITLLALVLSKGGDVGSLTGPTVWHQPQAANPTPSAGIATAVAATNVEPKNMPRSTGWYIHPDDDSTLLGIALQTGTDKVRRHNYQVIYGQLFEMGGGQPKVKKILEIGLGCNMDYGPGASAKLWKQFFPDAEIWFADYDKGCVDRYQSKIKELGIHVVTGDQGDTKDLHRWVKETGGNFDVIIDDGGHTNVQQFTSFMVLFQNALKPGGVYVIEDLMVDKDTPGPHPAWPDMAIATQEWAENFMGFPYRYERVRKHSMPPGIRTISCAPESCSYVKCYSDDKRCTYNGLEDASLAKYGLPIALKM